MHLVQAITEFGVSLYFAVHTDILSQVLPIDQRSLQKAWCHFY